MGRRGTLVGVALVLAMLGTACAKSDTGGSAGGANKPEVTVAFMGALTGPDASLEVGPRDAAGLVIEQANKKGDLPVTINYDPEDTQGVEAQALTIANKLVGNDRIVGLVGPGFTGESGSAGPILEQKQFPRITPSATAPTLGRYGWKYWFRGVANDDVQGGVAPDVLTKYLKVRKVFIAHDKSPYGQGLATIVQSKLPADMKVGFEGIDKGKEDYGALVTKVIGSGADAFYWGGYQHEAGLLVKQLKDRGFKGVFVGADGSKGEELLSGGGAAAEGSILTCPCVDPQTSDEPGAKAFVSDYTARYGKAPTIYAAEGHDAATILVDAIRKAGAPGSDMNAYREKVADNVRKTSGLQGVARTYQFQPSGELAGEPGIYLYKVQGGKYVSLGPVPDLVK
jgi:branched-chain amino acid transport system substrate-binding protein